MKNIYFSFIFILASATPSIETINNINLGKYDCVKLSSRFGDAVMPDVNLIDMRQNQPVKESWGKSWLSNTLVKQIEQKLEAKEQVMLYINRRGYAPLVLCSSCGMRLQCPNCNVYLTELMKENDLVYVSYEDKIYESLVKFNKGLTMLYFSFSV